MPRPIPDYVPGAVRDIVSQRWPENRLKGLAQHASLEYNTVLCTFKRSGNRSLFIFEEFCQLLKTDMNEVADMLALPEIERRSKLKALIYTRYNSIQELYREEGITDTYVEMLFRGDTGSRIVDFYKPLSRSLGLDLKGLAAVLRQNAA